MPVLFRSCTPQATTSSSRGIIHNQRFVIMLRQETPAFRHGEEGRVSPFHLVERPPFGRRFLPVRARKPHSEPASDYSDNTPLAGVLSSSTKLAVGTVPTRHWLQPRMPV